MICWFCFIKIQFCSTNADDKQEIKEATDETVAINLKDNEKLVVEKDKIYIVTEKYNKKIIKIGLYLVFTDYYIAKGPTSQNGW